MAERCISLLNGSGCASARKTEWVVEIEVTAVIPD